MIIQTYVDLSDAHGAIRNQGDRPTCLAFTLSDLNGHQHGQPASLSPEFLYREAVLKMPGWKAGEGLGLSAALDAVDAPGQPLETACPYGDCEPSLPLTPIVPGSPMYRGKYDMQSATMAPISAALFGNQSIGLVIRVTLEFMVADATTPHVPFSPNFLPGQSHAVLIVGFGEHAVTGERHVLIRNSWGPDWGRMGHAWLSEQYVATHGLHIFGA